MGLNVPPGLWFLAILGVVILGGCRKDGDKSDMLTSGAWKKASVDQFPENNPPGTVVYEPVLACETDDVHFFGVIKKLWIQRGDIKCAADENDLEVNYMRSGDQTTITIDSVTYRYLGISNNQMKYAMEIPQVSGFAKVFLFDNIVD